jgi:diguanylate cyclase (GGDEF)-like protein
MVIFGPSRYGPRKLPDAILAELVTMLIAGRLPIVVMVVTVACVAGFAATTGSPVVVFGLASVVIGLLALRFIVVTRYRSLTCGSVLSPDEVRLWERRYGRVIIGYAAMLGLFNAVVSIRSDPATHMLLSAEIFGFCAGQVSRASARPRLCVYAVLLGAVPTAMGMLVSVGQTTDLREGAAYTVLALLIMVYAITSIETVTFNYRTLIAQLESKRQMAGLARLDPLTKLPNRLVFMEQLQIEIDQAYDGSTVALHMIDLDGFKQVNDNSGHPVGDALLCAVAERLKRMIRAGDIAVRLGGDEFAVIQRGVALTDEAKLLGRRIVRQLGEPYRIGDIEVRITASDGIAHAPADTVDIDRLIEYADKALYKTKRGNGGGVGIWSGPEVLSEHRAA